MKSIKTAHNTQQPTLEQLLRRSDIWRGHSQSFVHKESIDTGYPSLNKALLHNGWPQGNMIDISANIPGHEWLVFKHAISALHQQSTHYIILINPPTQPYAVNLIQNSIPINQLILVTPKTKQDFIASFTEFCRCACCCVVFAWQLKYRLSYSELRKCQLVTAEKPGLYVLFRPRQTQQQNSPASLRIAVNLSAEHLQLSIFKQRGKLKPALIKLPLPGYWQAMPTYKNLDKYDGHSVYNEQISDKQ